MFNRHRNSAGFAHLFLTSAIVILVGLVGWFAVYQIQHVQKINKERDLYAAADKEAQTFISTVAKKYPGKTQHNTGCSYSSAKYSKGSLSCNVESTLTITLQGSGQKALLNLADSEQKKLPWDFAYDNTDPNLIGSENVISSRVYKNGSILCGVHYEYKWIDVNSKKFDKNTVLISADCSGPALAEYYK